MYVYFFKFCFYFEIILESHFMLLKVWKRFELNITGRIQAQTAVDSDSGSLWP